jgi:hypothetical protein
LPQRERSDEGYDVVTCPDCSVGGEVAVFSARIEYCDPHRKSANMEQDTNRYNVLCEEDILAHANMESRDNGSVVVDSCFLRFRVSG